MGRPPVAAAGSGSRGQYSSGLYRADVRQPWLCFGKVSARQAAAQPVMQGTGIQRLVQQAEAEAARAALVLRAAEAGMQGDGQPGAGGQQLLGQGETAKARHGLVENQRIPVPDRRQKSRTSLFGIAP